MYEENVRMNRAYVNIILSNENYIYSYMRKRIMELLFDFQGSETNS